MADSDATSDTATTRIQLPTVLCDELREVARARGRTENQLAPVVRDAIRHWIDNGECEESQSIREVSERLQRMEDLLRTLAEQSHLPARSAGPRVVDASPLDEVEERVLAVLRAAADDKGYTPPLSQKLIAVEVDESFVSDKVVGRAIETLQALGLVRIAKKAGQGVPARYRVLSTAKS